MIYSLYVVFPLVFPLARSLEEVNYKRAAIALLLDFIIAHGVLTFHDRFCFY